MKKEIRPVYFLDLAKLKKGIERRSLSIQKIVFIILLCAPVFLSAYGLEFSHVFDAQSAGTIQYLNEAPSSNTVAYVPNPVSIAFSSERGDIFVASSSSHLIYVLEHGTYQDVLNVNMSQTPTAIAWDSVDRTAYSSTAQGSVLSMDGDNFGVLGNASVPSPAGMSYDSVNDRIYVASSASNIVYVIDASSTRILKTITLCCSVSSLSYDPGNRYLYAAESASNTVAVVNMTSYSIAANVSVGSDPQYLIAEGHFVYVANYNSNSVSVIDGSTNTVSDTISNVGANPVAIAYNSYDGCYYVADYGAGAVSQICSGALNSTIAVGSEPDALVYDPSQYSILVANYGSGSISEITTQGAPHLPTTTSSSVTQNTAKSYSQSGTFNSTSSDIVTSTSNASENSSSAAIPNSSLAGAQPNYTALAIVLTSLVPEFGILIYLRRRET